MSAASGAPAYRLAVDIGGTFTDVVLAGDDGSQTSTKVLTTYDDPARGVMVGIDRCRQDAGGVAPEAVRLLFHGTTLATNALIERRGAVTALLTTEGHRDALEMALENRFEQYDLNIDRPRTLVPRALRLPVRERLAADGEVLLPLDEDSLEALLPALDAAAVESVAVGLLHAYVNGDHERRVADWLAARRPALSVTLASEVCPEIREYERQSTACANAYVRPLMDRYLSSLERRLADAGIRCPLLLMTSGGGLTTLETARRFPIRLVESGPAGGAILAARLARELDAPAALAFDMGGTTAKLALLDGGEPLLSRAFEVDRSYRFKKGSGLPVRIPVIEMVEIGAGGGSLARVDRLGRVQVGPESAGSEPGPACYGQGGEGAAVTDADALLGRLAAEGFAGGSLDLDLGAAAAAVRRRVAEPLQQSLDEAALAIAEVVDENMAAAARAHAVEWGRDLASRLLIAFGGAAPLHAARLAQKLKLRRVLIPRGAGVGSALGFLRAPIRYEVVRSRYQRLSSLDRAAVEAVWRELRDEAEAVVRPAAGDVPLREERRAFMRYLGQGYEIAVEVPAALTAEALREAFDAAYGALYGRVIPGLDVEVLSWTLSLSAPVSDGPVDEQPVAEHAAAAAQEHRPLLEPGVQERVRAACYPREALRPGARLRGPALVQERQTTTVVPAGAQLRVLAQGHLLLELDHGEGT